MAELLLMSSLEPAAVSMESVVVTSVFEPPEACVAVPPPMSDFFLIEVTGTANRILAHELRDIRWLRVHVKAVERRAKHPLGPPRHLARQIAFAQEPKKVFVPEAAAVELRNNWDESSLRMKKV